MFPMSSPRNSLSAVALAALLAGCAATPYRTPDVQLPQQWQHAAGSRQPVTLSDRWWTRFGDPQLDSLIDAALQRNTDLAVTAWKVRNARLAAGNAAGKLWPQPSGNLSASRQMPLNGDRSNSNSVSAALDVSWEIDLWGKLAAQQRMADWEAVATDHDREAAAQALVATVAKSYWQLAVLDRKLASQQASLDVARKTLELVQVQYKAGATSGLEVAQAMQNLASQQSTQAALVQQRNEQRNALSILFDAPPEALPAAAQQPRLPDMAMLPELAAGLPAELLARRPDLQAAEARLRSSLANVDATRTSYYPTLSLTGTLGTGSSALSGILSNPVATLGAGLALPFLRIGEMQRNTAIAQGSYEQAILNFRKTLYSALSDVENALSARTQLQLQETAAQQVATQARRAEELNGVRYRAGAVALKLWLDAQESRRSADLALLDAQLNRAVNVVNLYQVLGGSPVMPPVPAQTPPARGA